eukprot:COSAG03_NODE_134_length_11903_cov_30.799729_12_plen_63_part_00
MRRGAPFDTCFALSASTCIVSRLCIDTLGLVWLRILRPALDPPLLLQQRPIQYNYIYDNNTH